MAKQALNRKRKKRPSRVLLGLSIALLVLGCLGAGVLIGALRAFLLAPLPPFRAQPAVSTIYDRHGVVLARVYREYRQPVPLEQIAPDLKAAVLAIEDRRFYKHHGVDFKGLVRAAWANLRHRAYVQGASTITQQLARCSFLSPEKTLRRKLREMLLAFKLERRFSKEEILERYLNSVYFGSGAYGIQAAARTYFRTDAADLTLPQAALLAGLIRNPSRYNPFLHPEAAKQREQAVLQAMVEISLLTPAEASEAAKAPLHLAEGPLPRKDWKAPWFVHRVLRLVDERLGPEALYTRQLQVHTTLDYSLQQTAEKAVRTTCRRFASRGVQQAACVLLDAYTGEVLAWVGGKSFAESQFDRVWQARRQPGSAFKPLVYAAALEQGWQPDSVLEDKPVTFSSGGETYKPQNYDHRFRGKVTLAEALVYSINVPTVLLAQSVGLNRIAELAHNLGIESPIHPYLSSALGASELRPLELAGAYCAFCNLGKGLKPVLIQRVVEADGRVLFVGDCRPHPCLRPETAWELGQILKLAVEYGTGRPARISGWEIAGKTGTSTGSRDLWFAGFCSEAVCVVWAGNDQSKPTYGTYGGLVAAPVFKQVMRAYLAEYKPLRKLPEPVGLGEVKRLDASVLHVPRPKPEDVAPWGGEAGAGDEYVVRDICVDSGLLANPTCPHVVRKKFKPGTEPIRHCNLHP